MEQNFLRIKRVYSPCDPELFSSLEEEELTLTEALVGLSGLEVQRSGPQYTWDPDTLPPPLAYTLASHTPAATDQGL